MANSSTTAPLGSVDFDFWEFVCCVRCRMPFALENGSATIPFWLTECGHVVCNNHLNRDQSCAQCGAQEIQLAPLQREMELPMSEWFRSVPMALDSIAFAAKFQQEEMASQVRYYKARHNQLRQLVERFKRELSDMKRSHAILQSEVEQYRLLTGPLNADQETSGVPNSNGKRQMSDSQQFGRASRKSFTGSSPRPMTNLLGPDRLTLLPGQQHPEISSDKQHERRGNYGFTSHPDHGTGHTVKEGPIQHRSMSNRSHEQSQVQRPFSMQSLQHFAYRSKEGQNQNPPTPVMTYNPPHGGQHIPLDEIPALPTSSRFKPASVHNAATSHSANMQTGLTTRRQSNMGPPPIPQRIRSKESSGIAGQVQVPGTNDVLLHQRTAQTTGDLSAFVAQKGPLQHHPDSIGRRFFAQGPSNGHSSFRLGSVGGGSHPQEAQTVVPVTPASGQRTPFVPNSGQRGRFG